MTSQGAELRAKQCRIFGAAFTFCVMLPVFIIPIVRSIRTITPRQGHISIFSYWTVTFGLVLYGYFYDSSEPALNNLIFTWLLYV